MSYELHNKQLTVMIHFLVLSVNQKILISASSMNLTEHGHDRHLLSNVLKIKKAFLWAL